MGEYKSLSLEQLKVNPQNPRYRSSRISEADAILALFKEIKNRPETALRHMLNLIKDIVKHGTNLADLPIVVPDPDEGDTYQVMEGNRRIASLKLLYFPDLAVEVFQAEARTLKRLEGFRKDFVEQFRDQYKEILCVVYPTPEDARHWIYLRHTGENDGRGITPWDKAAKDRFRLQAADRKHTIATQVVEFLIQEGYLEPDIPVVLSTVERMVKDPDVASQLHIEILEDLVHLPSEPQLRSLSLKVLQRIALDTVEKDPQTKRKRLTSRHINQKAERLQYLERIIARISPPESFDSGKNTTLSVSKVVQTTLFAESKSQVPSTPTTSATAPESPPIPSALPSRPPATAPMSPPIPSALPSRPPATRDYKKRRQVAAKGIKVGYSTLNHLYQELCKLGASYPNVGMMGIRAFLEGSLDVFIQRFASEQEFQTWNGPHAPFKIPLSTKLSRTIDCLERQGFLPPNVAQAIRKYQSDKHNLLSVNTLQAYLHNPDLEPREDTVKYWWDAYHSFFEALWNTYNNATKR